MSTDNAAPVRARRTMYELPPLELECMKVLWRLGEASVRDIREELAAVRPLAYTTVETIMDRLTRKGIVAREKIGKAHRYTPRYAKEAARAQAVEAVVEHFFSGSRQALQAHLAGRPVEEPPPVPRAPAETRPPARARATPQRRPQPAPALDTTLL